MKKIILIHGYTSSPKRRKYQIISSQLNKIGIEHSIPIMPGGINPGRNDWLNIIDREVKGTTKPVVLVGHSLGTRAILLYLDKFDQKIDAVILFAAFNNDYIRNRKRRDGNYSEFFNYPIDIEKVKKRANKFVVVHSKDDDSIDYMQAVDISKDLGAKLITYNNMGHFSGEEKAEQNAKCFLKIISSTLHNK